MPRALAAKAAVRPASKLAVPAPNDQVAALDRQTAEIARLAETLASAVERVGPGIEALANLDHAQKKLCAWLVGNRVKILLSIPVVMTMIGAISPNAARVVAELLKVWGIQ